MPDINWLSFAMGVAFAVFVLPFLSSLLGRLRSRTVGTTATA